MPLHVYECSECETTFEKLIPSTAKIDVSCPGCESKKVMLSLAMPAKPMSFSAPMNCAGNGPPCGKTGCGRMRN